MAVCRVCSLTLTDDPSQVSETVHLESKVSLAIGESLCTDHFFQALYGNDNTAITSVKKLTDAEVLSATLPMIIALGG